MSKECFIKEKVGEEDKLIQEGSVLCSCIFTGRNAAVDFCKTFEFSICCE